MKLRVIALRFLIFLSAPHLLVYGPLFAQEGRLVITSNVPRASVYLENNLVAATDDKGSLVIDQLPEGVFHMELRKEGYKTFHAAVRIKSGQRASLNAKLLPYEKEAGNKAAKPAEAGRASKTKEKSRRSLAKKSEGQVTKKFTLVNPQEEETLSLKPGEARSSAETKVGGRVVLPLHFRALGLGIVGALLLFSTYWIIKVAKPKGTIEGQIPEDAEEVYDGSESPNGSRETEPSSGIEPYMEDTKHKEGEPESVRTLKKGFIKALRRKEELWQAGLISENKQKSPHESPQKPEVIIDLSKEHYRYDEEKREPH